MLCTSLSLSLPPPSLSLSLSLSRSCVDEGILSFALQSRALPKVNFKTSLGSKPSREHVHCFQYFSIDFCVDSKTTLGTCPPRDTHQTILYRLWGQRCRIYKGLNEPCHGKTCLRGFRPGLTRAGLYNHRKWIEAKKAEGLQNLWSKNLGANHRPVATFLKVVGRKSERMGGEHKRKVSTHTHCVSRKGVRGISPEKIFDLWLPLCAF